MNDFARWLIGLKETPDWASGGSWKLEFHSLPSGLWGAGVVALGFLAVAAIWWLYKKEGRELRRWVRVLLVGTRLMIFASLAAMLLEMVLVITKTEQTPSSLLVLVDSSESMALSDPYTDEEVARRVAGELDLRDAQGEIDLKELRHRPRLKLAETALARIKDQFADGRELSIYTFAGKLAPVEGDASDLKTTGADTALGEALKDALAAHRGQPLAGALVLTDGQSNSGSDPRVIAAQGAKEGIAIHSLAVGTEQGPSNARLAEIESSPVVFVHDPTEVAVLVESRGMEGQSGTVVLEQRRNGADWSDVGREDVQFGQDGAVERLTFKISPEATGDYDFRATIADAGTELTETDNTATRSMKVVRQRIRVLLISDYASPEVQFIRNALQRDAGIEFSSWLQSAQEGYEHIGRRPLRRLPQDQKELDQFDVLILFDPDPRALGPTWPDMLAKFVGDAGGGLVYVAGEQHSQALFSGGGSDGGRPIDNAWLRVLPISVDPTLYQSAAEARLSARETWNMELTAEGGNDTIFRFAPEQTKNREILASLPGMYWHFPVTRSKQGATVLAKHGDPRMTNQHGRHVLLATQLYGPGRTVFIGFDSTYRWRYLAEEYFDGFWARVVDRIGRNKVLGGRYPFTLSTDKSDYRAGDRVTVKAKIISSADDASPITDLKGELELPGQPPQTVEFAPLADGAPGFEASFPVDEAGAYMLRVTPNNLAAEADTENDNALRPATLGIKVTPPRQELDNPTLNRSLLDEVARASNGKVFTLSELASVPEAFTIKKVERVLEYRDEMWDAPILFGGMFLLLVVEWVLRKHFRMA